MEVDVAVPKRRTRAIASIRGVIRTTGSANSLGISHLDHIVGAARREASQVIPIHYINSAFLAGAHHDVGWTRGLIRKQGNPSAQVQIGAVQSVYVPRRK